MLTGGFSYNKYPTGYSLMLTGGLSYTAYEAVHATLPFGAGDRPTGVCLIMPDMQGFVLQCLTCSGLSYCAYEADNATLPCRTGDRPTGVCLIMPDLQGFVLQCLIFFFFFFFFLLFIVPFGKFGPFCVSVILRTLTWTTGSLTLV